MYFWKIGKLKEDIRNNSLTSQDNYYYLLSYTTLYTILLIVAVVRLYDSMGIWMAVIQVLLFVGGTYYAYYSNGRAKGKDFSKRFFSIAWVFLIRATFFMTIGMLNLYVMTHLFGMEKLLTVGSSAIIGLLFEMLFYWRIGKHIKDVATLK